MKTNYWKHIIRKFGNDGESIPVASYISSTSEDAVKNDLKNGFSHIRNYLNLFACSEDKLQTFLDNHPLRCEEILGGMSASLHYMLKTGDWLPFDPPPTQQIEFNPQSPPDSNENGIALWQMKKQLDL